MSKFTRRDFINLGKTFLTVTGLAVVLGPVIAYFYPANLEETPSEPVLVCAEEELGPGESKTIRFGRYPAIVINTTEGLRAYSAVCGYFNPHDGAVISGPPPTPLDSLQIEIDNGDIYVGGAA